MTQQQEAIETAITKFTSQLVTVQSVSMNTSQEVIVTTVDKARICLMEYLSNVEKRNSWVAPLGILITLVITLSTTTTRDFLVKADVWQAVFIIGVIITALWLGLTLYRLPKAKKIDDILNKLKAQQEQEK